MAAVPFQSRLLNADQTASTVKLTTMTTYSKNDYVRRQQSTQFRSLCAINRNVADLPTAWARLFTLSLRITFCRWFFTVGGLMPRIWPTSMLVLPFFTQCST